jgi:hypothetical protein
VLRLLRGRELTADELATRPGVTPNAARFHLAELERGGLGAQRAVRRGPRKPSSGYSLTDRGEALFPERYDALLNAVLWDLRADHTPGGVAALLRRLGRELAVGEVHRFAGRASAARGVLGLNASNEMLQQNRGFPIWSSLAGTLRKHLAVWMATWWFTEAIPLAATSLLPLVVYPLLGPSELNGVAQSYADNAVLLFLGVLLLARGISEARIDERVALHLLKVFGGDPYRLVAGFTAWWPASWRPARP